MMFDYSWSARMPQTHDPAESYDGPDEVVHILVLPGYG